MARRATAAGSMRYPHGLETQPQNVLQLRERGLRVVERQQCDAHQSLILATELCHAAIVRARGCVAFFDRTFEREGETFGEGREHELTCETQQVECLRAFRRVECAERHVAFRTADQSVAEREQLGDLAIAVLAIALGFFDESGETSDARNLDARYALAHVRVGIFGEEVRQLHDVAVGVVTGAAVRVRHQRIPPQATQRSETILRPQPVDVEVLADLHAERRRRRCRSEG